MPSCYHLARKDCRQTCCSCRRRSVATLAQRGAPQAGSAHSTSSCRAGARLLRRHPRQRAQQLGNQKARGEPCPAQSSKARALNAAQTPGDVSLASHGPRMQTRKLGSVPEFENKATDTLRASAYERANMFEYIPAKHLTVYLGWRQSPWIREHAEET